MCINQRDDISHVKKKSAVSIQSADSLSPQSSTNIYYIQYIMYIWWFFIHIILYISMNIHIHWVYVMWILHHSQIIFLTRYLGTKTLFIGSFIICICIFKWFSLLVYYDLLFFSEIEFESIASIVCKKKWLLSCSVNSTSIYFPQLKSFELFNFYDLQCVESHICCITPLRVAWHFYTFRKAFWSEIYGTQIYL